VDKHWRTAAGLMLISVIFVSTQKINKPEAAKQLNDKILRLKIIACAI
jgi:hypothetical protein